MRKDRKATKNQSVPAQQHRKGKERKEDELWAQRLRTESEKKQEWYKGKREDKNGGVQ